MNDWIKDKYQWLKTFKKRNIPTIYINAKLIQGNRNQPVFNSIGRLNLVISCDKINADVDLFNNSDVRYTIDDLHAIVNDSHCSINSITSPTSNNCAKFVNEWVKGK